MTNGIKWNFTKFVVGRDGVPVARLGHGDDPIPKVEREVRRALGLDGAPKKG